MADRKRANESRPRTNATIWEYGLPSADARDEHSRFMKVEHSGPVQPSVVNTSGVNDPLSTFLMRSAYSSFLEFSCIFIVSSRHRSR